MGKEMLLEMKGIDKIFGGSYALKNVEFSIRKGEVHALLGENGAGKSTLIKILTGVYPKDGGEIYLNGEKVEINSRSDAAELGIGVIYQELSLIPTLSVMQNVMLGNESKRLGVLAISEMKKTVQKMIDKYGFKLNPNDIVETLSVAQQQTVEILKALITNASLIVMDEPTASLSNEESEILFKIIHQLQEKEVSILYISHRLDEVFQLADCLTVLRDGVNVGIVEKDEIEPAKVVKMMIGKELRSSSASDKLCISSNANMLEVKNLTRHGFFKDINFAIKKGEIVALTGLVGAGRTEFIRAIFGMDLYDEGSVILNNEKLKPGIEAAMKKGVGFIPEDRRTQGFYPALAITQNVASTNYDMLSKAGFVDKQKEKKLGENIVGQLKIKATGINQKVGTLSGGNQQKVVLGKWLPRDLKVLLVDEPTVGIDIGAKNEIYEILENLASKGVAVLVVSSDIQEVLRVGKRIIVMRNGEIFKEFNDGVVTQEDILLASSGIEKR